MNSDSIGNGISWPIEVKYELVDDKKSQAKIDVFAGLTTLVGPNGSGKTRALRAIKSELKNSPHLNVMRRKVHFLSAGRSSPFEHYRASSNSPHGMERGDAAVGDFNYVDQWWEFESITGDLMILDRRPDLKLKIEARLQQLFDRSVELKWSQRGLSIRINSISGGDGYSASHEASGILQVVALLSAIHNDEIGVLLIDEPEISLHPQHQAFLLEEMKLVAGDPSDLQKKLIVIATHSPSMLPIQNINELPKIAFFTSAQKVPAQIEHDSGILRSSKLTTLISRLSATHRTAMFAEHILMVEGPSDEIVLTQLARKFNFHLLARNSQILPVLGKGEFIEAAKMFSLMNKRVSIMADLDALVDDNDLVNYFSELPEAKAVSEIIGRENLADLDRDLRVALTKFMTEFNKEVDIAADEYPDWSGKDSKADTKRRVTLARILSSPESFEGDASEKAKSLNIKYKVLTGALEKIGCFFLHRGAIENYYILKDDAAKGKPELAALEAAGFESREYSEITKSYGDIYTALKNAAPHQLVDEDILLRMKLGAILPPVMLSMKFDSTDDQLDAIARSAIGADARVFKLINTSTELELKFKIYITSQLFQRTTFPFEVKSSDNPISIVLKLLPGLNHESSI